MAKSFELVIDFNFFMIIQQIHPYIYTKSAKQVNLSNIRIKCRTRIDATLILKECKFFSTMFKNL
jgi:hypothetical protein